MSKYVSKENFEQYDSKLKEYIDETLLDNLDLLSYGVSWTTELSDPHLTRVGNMTYHKTLPILNNMKGCIALMKDGPKIMYYLHPDNWGRRKDPIILKNKQINYNESKTKWLVVDDVFGTKLYTNCHIYILGYEFNVDSIDTENKTAEISYNGVIKDGNYYDIELGAVLSGYDGEVMVEVPEFWIKSWDGEDKKEVRISPTYIDDSWEHLQHCLVGAYKETILREVPENWGYLSTLPINSALSVVNIQKFCRGGNNDSSKDYLINSNFSLTNLCKPATSINLYNFIIYCRRSGKEVMNYLLYKRIMYWLYVIEYANFNCLENFTNILTYEGFKQGGLGVGLTNVNALYWSYMGYLPLIKKGINKKFGNKTCSNNINLNIYTNKDLTETISLNCEISSYHGIELPFGDISNLVSGVICIRSDDKHMNVYATENPNLYLSNYEKYKKISELTIDRNIIKEFNLKNTAEIIPNEFYNNPTMYKCDYCFTSNIEKSGIVFGADCRYGYNSGIATCDFTYNINVGSTNFGARSICIIK